MISHKYGHNCYDLDDSRHPAEQDGLEIHFSPYGNHGKGATDEQKVSTNDKKGYPLRDSRLRPYTSERKDDEGNRQNEFVCGGVKVFSQIGYFTPFPGDVTVHYVAEPYNQHNTKAYVPVVAILLDLRNTKHERKDTENSAETDSIGKGQHMKNLVRQSRNENEFKRPHAFRIIKFSCAYYASPRTNGRLLRWVSGVDSTKAGPPL